MLLSALRLSLVVSLLATLLVAVSGTLVGWLLARRKIPGGFWVDALVSLPLVLPPTVTGYYLLVLLGRRGLLGGSLHTWTGVSIPFSWIACVIAAAVMAFPLMARSARVAFEQIDRRHEVAAASLGCSPTAVFLRVSLPLARRGLTAGLVLSFARALGEFGATLMLAGNVPGRTQTLPLAIYEAMVTGRDDMALILSLLLTAVSIVVVAISGWLTRERRR